MIPLLITLLASFGAVALLEMGIRKRGATLGQLSSLLTTSVVLALLGLILLFRGGFMIGIPALAAAGVAYWRYGQLKLLATHQSTKPQAAKPARGNGGDMDRAQALAVLGLPETASDADVTAAHRRLITGLHPDQGGSDFLAAQINEARDVLLG
jgi:DnaJ homolog subfamily C member 19